MAAGIKNCVEFLSGSAKLSGRNYGQEASAVQGSMNNILTRIKARGLGGSSSCVQLNRML